MYEVWRLRLDMFAFQLFSPNCFSFFIGNMNWVRSWKIAMWHNNDWQQQWNNKHLNNMTMMTTKSERCNQSFGMKSLIQPDDNVLLLLFMAIWLFMYLVCGVWLTTIPTPIPCVRHGNMYLSNSSIYDNLIVLITPFGWHHFHERFTNSSPKLNTLQIICKFKFKRKKKWTLPTQTVYILSYKQRAKISFHHSLTQIPDRQWQ